MHLQYNRCIMLLPVYKKASFVVSSNSVCTFCVVAGTASFNIAGTVDINKTKPLDYIMLPLPGRPYVIKMNKYTHYHYHHHNQ